MTSGRDSSLLRLQRSLMEPASCGADENLDFLPFEAAQKSWLVPCAEVARVMMPSDVIHLAGYARIPACVVGVVATASVMLSVVDAGLLLGSERAHSSLKSRLIVFGEGQLKGIAILVDRVHARINKSAGHTSELIDLSAAVLHDLIAKQTTTPKED